MDQAEVSSPRSVNYSRAAQLVEEIKTGWRDGIRPDASGILHIHPELVHYKSIVLDLAYEEYCLRLEAGDPPDPDEFCRRFPEYRKSLRKVLDAHQFLLDNPNPFGAETRWPAVGERIEGLELRAALGRGAFARVFLAYDPGTGRECAVKVVRGASPEGRVIGNVRHPHITDIYWARRTGTLTAVCMPFVSSVTLENVLEAIFHCAGPPTAGAFLAAVDQGELQAALPPTTLPVITTGMRYPDAVCAVAVLIADALCHLHVRGFVHGDLKPSNVLVGSGGHPWLIDFNLAGPSDRSGTVTGGTLPYMPPEVLSAVAAGRFDALVDPVCVDVYSFGVTLHEMLTGKVPFAPPDGCHDPRLAAAELADLVANGWASVARALPSVPSRLANLVTTCLAPEPRHRPPTMEAVRGELASVLARRATVQRLRRFGLTAIVVGTLAGGVLWQVSGDDHPDAIDSDPMRTAIAHLHAGRPEAAVEDLLGVEKASPDARTAAWLAYGYARLVKHRQAEYYGTQAIERGDESAAVLNNLGYSLAQLQRPDEALPFLDRATRADPDCQAAYYNRSLIRFNAGDLDGATDDIDQALRLKPRSPDLLTIAFQIYTITAEHDPKRITDAISTAEAAIKHGVDPAKIEAAFRESPALQASGFDPTSVNPPASGKPNTSLQLRLIAPSN